MDPDVVDRRLGSSKICLASVSPCGQWALTVSWGPEPGFMGRGEEQLSLGGATQNSSRAGHVGSGWEAVLGHPNPRRPQVQLWVEIWDSEMPAGWGTDPLNPLDIAE